MLPCVIRLSFEETKKKGVTRLRTINTLIRLTYGPQNRKALTALLIAVFLTATACGGNENHRTRKNTENEPQKPAPETPDLTLPAEAVFAAQIAQSLLGEPLTDNDQNCLFTAATDNDAFAEAIAAVLDQNASLTPTYFKSLITSVRDCVGQQRMSNAIALGLSLNEEKPELSECLNETFLNDPSEDAFLGMAAITAGIAVPPDVAPQTIETLNNCVSIDVIANQLALQYEQLQSFQSC